MRTIQTNNHPSPSHTRKTTAILAPFATKMLRMALVFMLTFWSTLGLQTHIAYGTEAGADAAEQARQEEEAARQAEEEAARQAAEEAARQAEEEAARQAAEEAARQAAEEEAARQAAEEAARQAAEEEARRAAEEEAARQAAEEAARQAEEEARQESVVHHYVGDIKLFQDETSAFPEINQNDSEDNTPSNYADQNGNVFLTLEEDEETHTYTFKPYAQVTVKHESQASAAPDSDTYMCTPVAKNNLSALTSKQLPDLEWKLIPYDLGESRAAGKDPLKDKTEKEIKKAEEVSKSVASLNTKTGELVVAAGEKVCLVCESKAAYGWDFDINDTQTSTTKKYLFVTTEEAPEDPEKTDDPTEVEQPLVLSYDANGGQGTMTPGEADEKRSVTVAECLFEAPEGKKFDSWNTQPEASATTPQDGTDPSEEQEGASPNTEEEADTQTDTDTASPADGEQDADGLESSATPELTDPTKSGTAYKPGDTFVFEPDQTQAVLYAQWVDDTDAESTDQTTGDNKDTSGEGSDFDDDHVVPRVSYSPAPLGRYATLSPIVSNLGHGDLAYLWQRSTDGGKTWEDVFSDEILTLSVLTDENSLGHLYRFALRSSKIIDTDRNSTLITSEPVEIVELTDPYFIMLAYDPVEEGQPAIFTASSIGLDPDTFEWEVSKNGGKTWETIEGAHGNSLSVDTTTDNMGNFYRVKALRPTDAEDTKDSTSAGTTSADTTSADDEASENTDATKDADSDNTTDANNTDNNADENDNSTSAATSSTSKDTSAKDRYVYSNIHMLVATVPDAEPISAEDFMDETKPLSSPRTTDDGDSADTTESTENNDNENASDYDPDLDAALDNYTDEYQEENIDTNEYADENPNDIPYDADELNNATPIDAPIPTDSGFEQAPADIPEATPLPEPEPTPAPTPEPEPTPEPVVDLEEEPQEVVVDQEVTEKIAEQHDITSAEPTTPTGQWRRLTVIEPEINEDEPEPFELPDVPLTIPTALGLVASGMVERLYSFRRQTRESKADFSV